jgi:hypothetical protein
VASRTSAGVRNAVLDHLSLWLEEACLAVSEGVVGRSPSHNGWGQWSLTVQLPTFIQSSCYCAGLLLGSRLSCGGVACWWLAGILGCCDEERSLFLENGSRALRTCNGS